MRNKGLSYYLSSLSQNPKPEHLDRRDNACSAGARSVGQVQLDANYILSMRAN